MKMVTVVTYLDEDDAREIQRIAERMGLSVAAVVRMCVRYVLHEAVVATPLQTIARLAGEKEGEKDAAGETR